MTDRLGDAPIQPDLLKTMNLLASGLDEILNGKNTKPKDRKNGFILMVFPFEDHEGRANYISNANREDIIVLLKEQLARFQGAPETKGK